jgi:uncharacterized protein YvpB
MVAAALYRINKLAGFLQQRYRHMDDKKQTKRHFSLLTAVGILFAITLCLLASAMVYVAFPTSVPLLRLVFEETDSGLGISSPLSFIVEATPFQPKYTQSAEETEPPAPTPVPQSTPVPEDGDESAPFVEPDLDNIPASHYLSGLYGTAQWYNLDCEAQAAVDFARFFGFNINRQEFLDKMPRSDDPEEGFVGEVNGAMGQLPPGDYGIYAKPIAKMLRDYGLEAQAVRGWSLDQIRAEIAAGRPVIAWIVNLPFEIDAEDYTASNGNTVPAARFEHTWIVTGYNMNTFTVVDSVWTYNVKISTFKERWGVLGSQAIVYRGN